MATRIQEKDYPRQVTDLIGSPWYFRAMEIVRGFHLHEDVDDTMQDILTSMFQKNYLARWDKSKGGSYGNWVLTFVINHCRRKYIRSHTRGGRAIEGAASLSKAIDEEGDSPLGAIIEDKSRGTEDFWIRVAEIFAQLLNWDRYPDYRPHSFNRWNGSEVPLLGVVDDTPTSVTVTLTPEPPEDSLDDEGLPGIRYARCPAEVFRLIVLEGLSVKEIAERFATSTSYVNSLMAKIRPVVARIFGR